MADKATATIAAMIGPPSAADQKAFSISRTPPAWMIQSLAKQDAAAQAPSEHPR